VEKLELEQFYESDRPAYAILSHTWGKEEVTYDDMINGIAKQKKGYAKIEGACALARTQGLRHVWVDTCCIDKRSSSELSEAINSMFRWYLNSSICYAYLEDVSDESLRGPWDTEMNNFILRDALGRSRWFTRGWTLQELIAPKDVVFYSRIWSEFGSKESLIDFISLITGINEDILRCGIDKRQTHTSSAEFLNLWWEKKISSKSVATRMSWFGDRQTTRPEDVAYSLLGIFGVQMPLLYGEDNFDGPIAIPLLRMQTGAEIYFRDPGVGPTVVNYDKVTEDDLMDTSQSHSTEIVRSTESLPLRTAIPHPRVQEDHLMDVSQSDDTEIVRSTARLAPRAARSDRHKGHWKTIFIPKRCSFNEYSADPIEHFQLQNVPREFEVIAMHPSYGWNRRTQTMRLSLSNFNNYGFLSFRIRSSHPVSPSALAVLVGLRQQFTTSNIVHDFVPWICLEPIADDTTTLELSVRAANRSDSWKALESESSLRIFDGSSMRVLKVTIKREARMGQIVSFIAFGYGQDRCQPERGDTSDRSLTVRFPTLPE
jgi:hypothetical protein